MTKRISANRRNSEKSTGPNNTTATRFNATKHGLLADGITELDNGEEYRNTIRRLNDGYFMELETFLVERIALNMIRLRRSGRLEAEYITAILPPPVYGEAQDALGLPSFEPPLLDPGLPASVSSEKFEPLVNTFQRYDTALENKVELERLRRMIKGEHLPAPAAVDVTVHTDPREADASVESPGEGAQQGSPSEPQRQSRKSESR